MAKRKIIYEDEDDSDDNASVAVVKKRTIKSASNEGATTSEATSTRRSTRSSKGTGGRLSQMQELERIQTMHLARPSKLDLATQGEDTNPMAPSFQDADEDNSRSSGRRSNGIVTTVPDTRRPSSTPPPVSSSQPIFSQAAHSEKFGFRLPVSNPQTQAPPRKRFVATNTRSSSRKSTPPVSLFSGRLSTGTSATSVSRASSVCSSTARRTYSQVVQQQPLLPQPTVDAGVVSLQSSVLSPVGTNHHTLRQLSNEDPRADLHRSTARLVRTESFYNLPLSMDRDGHSLSAAPLVANEENLEIDEASPSEDERLAEQFLHKTNDNEERDTDMDDIPVQDSQDPPRGFQAAGSRLPMRPAPTVRWPARSTPSLSNAGFVEQAEDVVAAHRKRNRAPRLPNNSQLLAARRRRTPSTPNADELEDSNSQVVAAPRSSANNATPPSSFAGSSAGPPSAPQASGENGTAPQVIAQHLPVGPAAEGSDPWQLQYYDPPTRDIIERAKQFSHCDAASINSFPLRPNFNVKAIEYVDEAIAERRSRGLIGWWPQHSSGITRLLWEDLGNWRSALRKKARTWVAQRYQWDPEARQERNAEIAKELLGGGGLFLRDGVDEEGHVNNLAHPALSGLVIDFFYTGAMSVGKLFPEVFAAAVPRPAVALAATALKVVLDGIVSGQASDVNFKVNTYSPVYTEILGLMDKCDSSVIHGAKTRALRERWASQGCGSTTVQSGVAASGFDVDLG